MPALFATSALLYILTYAFEGVVRYGLYLVGADSLILLRDALLVVPVLWLGASQARQLRLHPAFFVFLGIILVHGIIIYGNFHTVIPITYGAKLLFGELFGFIAAAELTRPSPRALRILVLIWIAVLAGVAFEKFVASFPWVGLTTHIGGITVDVSHGWDIQDAFQKRAAGFTRSSIASAIILPILAILIATRTQRFLLRMLVLVTTMGGVFLTTQKGSVIAIVAVGFLLLFTPRRARYPLLAIAAAAFAVLDVLLPIATSGLPMAAQGGVFSLDSFALRMDWIWPDAWRWIAQNQIFPFGVGLGGIGGAQRFYTAAFFNPCDNLFLFMYGNFGLIGLVYLAWPVVQAFRLPRFCREEALPAVALLAFLLGYGAVLSLMEDQMCALFLGASAGMLWQLRQRALGRRWADSYHAWGEGASAPTYTPAPHSLPGAFGARP